MLIAGQTAIVTGAGSGIGRAIACALAGRGLRVLLVGRDEAKLRAAGVPNAIPLVADVTQQDGRARVAAAAGDALGVLVHSAGAHARAAVAEQDEAAWQAMLAVNLHGPVLLTSACLNQLRAARGQVVFINSSAALQPAGVGMAAYAGSKAALRAAADALRAEVNGDGVRVLSVFPGRTDTPMQAAILADEGRRAAPGALLAPADVAMMVLAALALPETAEVTEIVMRPMRKL
ncbi:MAG: SDR family NAD(P)-dependent oxidoreductase [Rhodospirillales bacterium]|nr:SDR family NAD(P)-dependent oxidoreductase [Rhodospirillales bacterium]